MCRARNRLQLAAVSERNGILLVVSLSFLAGCLSALRLTGGLWLWGLAGLSLLMGWLLRRRGAGAGIALAVCFFALGALRFQSAYFTPQPDPGTYEITGYVYGGASERPDQRVAFVLGDVALDGTPASGMAYCTLHYDDVPPVLFDGAQVRFEGRVYLPDGKSGEPHMDFALWMRQSGQSFGIAAYQGIAVLNGEADAPVRDAAYRVRQSFTRALERVMGEEARVAVRNALRDANTAIEKAVKNDNLPEDESKRAEAEIQKMTDRFVAEVDEVLKKKEAEVMEI